MLRALAATLPCLILTCAIAMAAKAPARKPAAAPEELPMRFPIVKSAEGNCEPDCREWIAAEGKIDAGAVARFKSTLKQLGGRKLPIVIHSGGGDMDAGFAIGRLVRKAGLDVAVGRTVIVPCAANDAVCRKIVAATGVRGLPDETFAVCASACAFVLAAGTRRYVGPRAFVGVHQILVMQTWNKVLRTYQVTVRPTASGRPRVEKKLVATKIVSQKTVPQKAPQSIYLRIEDYFSEMGVGRQIMPMLQGTPHASVRWLTAEELLATGMATHRINAAQIIRSAAAPGGAKSQPASDDASVAAPLAAECQNLSGIGMGCLPLLPPKAVDWPAQAPEMQRTVPAR
jgi:hypothetical protein